MHSVSVGAAPASFTIRAASRTRRAHGAEMVGVAGVRDYGGETAIEADSLFGGYVNDTSV
jgi:hypothetical protein